MPGAAKKPTEVSPLIPTGKSSKTRGNGLIGDIVVALLATFLGAVDGFGLGAVIFPPGTPSEFTKIGMQIGLLTAFVTNLALLCGSQIRFSVGGGAIPQVAVMTGFFTMVGPDKPHTIMVALPAITLLSGGLAWLTGRYGASFLNALHKTFPTTVIAGFWTGTGVSLIEYALVLICPGFRGFAVNPGALFTARAAKLAGAPICVATIVFGLERSGIAKRALGSYAPFLLVVVLAVQTVAFSAFLLASGTSLADARTEGWLLPVEMPTRLDFDAVWTMQDASDVVWKDIASPSFVIALLASYVLGMLTIVKNTAGVASSLHVEVDVAREVRLYGLTNLICGAAGAMPGVMVGSYTRTVYELGSRSRNRFLGLLVFFSMASFVFGGYVVAVMPVMVPGVALVWLGLVLCAPWFYDAIGTVTLAEHSVVLVMVALDLTSGASTMVLAGLLATLALLASNLHACNLFRVKTTLAHVRSDVQRCVADRNRLNSSIGGCADVLVVARTVLDFHNAYHLLEHVSLRVKGAQVEALPRPAKPPPIVADPLLYLVIDLAAVPAHLGLSVTTLSVLKEITTLSRDNEFILILSSLPTAAQRALCKYGVPCVALCDSLHIVSDPSQRFGVVHFTAPLSGCGSESAWSQTLGCGSSVPAQVLQLRCLKQVGQTHGGFIDSLNRALQWVEDDLLRNGSGCSDFRSSVSSNDEASRKWLKHLTWRGDRSANLEDAEHVVKRAAPSLSTTPLFGLAVHLHRVLENYVTTYEAKALRSLPNYIEVKEVRCGECLWAPSLEHVRDIGRVVIGGLEGDDVVPPLIWVLHGAIEHWWIGQEFALSYLSDMAERYNLADKHTPIRSADVQVGLKVLLTPKCCEGGVNSGNNDREKTSSIKAKHYRFAGRVISVDSSVVRIHWNEEHSGGPPRSLGLPPTTEEPREWWDKEGGASPTSGSGTAQRLEKVILASNMCTLKGREASDPLQTFLGFLGGMAHPGVLVGSSAPDLDENATTACAVLRRSRWLHMKREQPDLHELITIYLTRKRFQLIGASSATNHPKLLL